MFNKLVVSTNEKRSKRTARFFFGTSIIYLLAVVCAFAVSILVANPKLADSSETIIITRLPPAPRLVKDGPRHEPQVRQQQDPRNVQDLGTIMSKPASAALRRSSPPGASSNAFNGSEGVPGGSQEGVIGSLGKGLGVSGGDNDEGPPLPKPPDPPRANIQARAADNKQPLRVTSKILQGKATVRRTPAYPPLARQMRLQGAVSVEVMIAPDGHVESARAVSGHILLVSAAEEAARAWRFEPTMLNDTPVRVTGIIVFNFKLGE
jgi:TonB family protein